MYMQELHANYIQYGLWNGNNFSFYHISLIFRIPPTISLNFFETEKVLVLGSIMLNFCVQINLIRFIFISWYRV